MRSSKILLVENIPPIVMKLLYFLCLCLTTLILSDIRRISPYGVPVGVYPYQLSVYGQFFRKNVTCKFSADGRVEETSSIFINSTFLYCPIPRVESEFTFDFFLYQRILAFEIFLPPLLRDLAPSSASLTSGLAVKLDMRNSSYRSDMIARFGDLETPVLYDSIQGIYCNLPHAKMPKRVQLELSLNRIHFNSTLLWFVYYGMPYLESILPTYVHTRGGVDVTLYGGGPFVLTDHTYCKFDDFTMTKAMLLSSNEIKCPTPVTNKNITTTVMYTQNLVEWATLPGNLTFDERCSCSGKGRCVDKLLCVCDPGWKGEFCNICSKNCNHGICNAAGSCECHLGFAGTQCNSQDMIWNALIIFFVCFVAAFFCITGVLVIKNLKVKSNPSTHFSSL
jgi:hypothetical protein